MTDFLDDTPTEAPETKTGRPVAIALGQPDPQAIGPRVIAKGQGKVADQILAIAFDRGVKVRSDADLAEILAAVELDSEVPVQALAAVAEILNYVYRASGHPNPESHA